MASIRVDHSQFEKTASAIEAYIGKHKNAMGSIDQSIASLSASWQGPDYTQLNAEWQRVNSPQSTSGRMLQSLESYADFLRFAAKKYKTAQANAINRAGKLPRY